jgi:hypothetical protein
VRFAGSGENFSACLFAHAERRTEARNCGRRRELSVVLAEEQRERVHWKTAVLMLNNAMKESRYLTTAIVNLRSALLYDRLIEQ